MACQPLPNCSTLALQSQKMVLSDLETCKPTSSSHHEVGISRSERDLPPSHYLFKIESYSELMKTGVEKYETNVFEAGGYKWRLILYPNGNIKHSGSGYVSLYLAIADTEKFSHGWEVNHADGTVRKFHEMKTEWGFDQLLLLETLSDPSKGYLVEDSCAFGAEVFVIKHSDKWESLSMVKEPTHGTFTWKIHKFSTLDEASCLSKPFTVGGREWKLRVHPKGDTTERGKSLSVFLYLTDCDKFPPKRTVYAQFKMRLLDQLRNKYFEKTARHWFSVSSNNEWGYHKLIALSELYEAAKGYIKDDTIIVEVQILVISIVKN